MVESPVKAFVDIDFTEYTNGTMRACAFKIVDQIIADTIILTWIRVTIINVEFAVFTLITLGT